MSLVFVGLRLNSQIVKTYNDFSNCLHTWLDRLLNLADYNIVWSHDNMDSIFGKNFKHNLFLDKAYRWSV